MRSTIIDGKLYFFIFVFSPTIIQILQRFIQKCDQKLLMGDHWCNFSIRQTIEMLLKMYIPFDLLILLLGIYSEE